MFEVNNAIRINSLSTAAFARRIHEDDTRRANSRDVCLKTLDEIAETKSSVVITKRGRLDRLRGERADGSGPPHHRCQ